MNGKEIFKSAVRVMGKASTDIIEQQGYTPEDLNRTIIGSKMISVRLILDEQS